MDSLTRFLTPIFHRWTPPKPLTQYFKTFPIWLQIRGDTYLYLRFFIDSPLLFRTESQYFSYCLIQRVATLRINSGELLFVIIICMNSHPSFNTESQYSLYCLILRVTTPRIVYSGESLLAEESYFQKL
jgi:hypothetical protein